MTMRLPDLHIEGTDSAPQIVRVRSLSGSSAPQPEPPAPRTLGDFVTDATDRGIKPAEIVRELIKLPVIK
jgi:hypothetical protein